MRCLGCQNLKGANELTPVIEGLQFKAPMVYPFLAKNNLVLKQQLIKNNIYVATYWTNVIGWLEKSDTNEERWQRELLPLPIDQRITKDGIEIIANQVLDFIDGK